MLVLDNPLIINYQMNLAHNIIRFSIANIIANSFFKILTIFFKIFILIKKITKKLN